MKNPVSHAEKILRAEAAINRVIDARETVVDRIVRGGYTVADKNGRAIMRKAGRMEKRIAGYQTDLEALRKGGD